MAGGFRAVVDCVPWRPLVQESPSVGEVLQLWVRRRAAHMPINDRSGTLVGLWLITTLPHAAVV